MRIVPAQPHGPLREVLPGLHVVKGTMRIGPARLSRNMVVVERGEDLVLVNSVRLSEAGLAALDALGRVTDVVRLAAGHGSDDPFYKDRYGASVWDIEGQRYFEGVRWDRGKTYFHSDHALDGEHLPALPDARLVHFRTTPPEALLLLPHAGGTLISGDVLQNWADAGSHFNLFGCLGFRLLGFIGPHKLGKGWLDLCRPDPTELLGLLELPFENVLPAHGDPVIGGAPDRYRPAVEAWARSARSNLS
jgi:hypothetical protein